MFNLAAWIHCFVYISKGLVSRGYIHFVFIISILESMLLHVTTGGTGHTLACTLHQIP